MPATCSTRGILKASTNRVRTSTALQGSAMWENVIGIVNEERGSNAGVEALINAPQRGGGRQASQARRAAAAEAVRATGGFDTAITDYEGLLALAKTQGAVGGSNRGACKVCGQMGHLAKQCRNQFSKFHSGEGAGAAAAAGTAPDGTGALPGIEPLGSSDDSGLSSSSSSDSDSSGSEEERRRRHKKRKRKEKKERKERHREKKRRREKKEKKEKKHRKKEKRSKRSSSPSHSD